jgi:hypothetical protein
MLRVTIAITPILERRFKREDSHIRVKCKSKVKDLKRQVSRFKGEFRRLERLRVKVYYLGTKYKDTRGREE